MKKTLAFISIDMTKGEFPLFASYLSGYARLDPEIKEYWDFKSHVFVCASTSLSQITPQLEKIEADVLAFSCYVWNMGLIRELIKSFPKDHPNTQIILGGPQISLQGKKYLHEDYENVVICNGEGEITFQKYLKELMKESCDFANVKGLSFYKNKKLITNEKNESIENLDEIPSPFYNDLFDVKGYYTIRMETNRNCVFSCKYCYWGNQGAKPTKFSVERIKADLLEIVKKGTPRIHIVDANFGIFKRDIEITKYIVELKKEYGFPEVLIFPPPAPGYDPYLPEICDLLLDAEIEFTYEIGLQSVSPAALKEISKKYLFKDYAKLQKLLNEKGVNSRIDTIWPLPGETIESYKKGIAKLCEAKADTIIYLPLILLNNTALERQRDEYGLVTKLTKISANEEEFVIQTNHVSQKQYVEGLRFAYSAFILNNIKSMYMTSWYLHGSGLKSYDNLFSDFVEFILSHEDMPAHAGLKSISQIPDDWFATLACAGFDLCIEKRDLYDQWLFKFLSTQDWQNDETACFYFEADLLNRGYIYQKQVKPKKTIFKYIKILKNLPDSYIVEIQPKFIKPLNKILGLKADFNSTTVQINHKQSQSKFNENSSKHEQLADCFRMTMFNSKYMPMWQNFKEKNYV